MAIEHSRRHTGLSLCAQTAWLFGLLGVLGLPGVRAEAQAGDDGRPDPYHGPALELVDRSISLLRPEQGEQGDHRRRWLTWQVDYRLRNAGPSALQVDPETIVCTVEGWASNSRAEGHGLPRRADHALSLGDAFRSKACLIEHDDPTRACLERATLEVRHEEGSDPLDDSTAGVGCDPSSMPAALEPGEVLEVRLRLEHCHHLHGPVEPLLGARELTLLVGPTAFRDTLPLDRAVEPGREMDRLSPIPPERRDSRVYFSPPDSLYLDAALAGFRSFQFRDLKVPRDTTMRLSFRYLRSVDSTGEVRVELKQYQDVPNAYRVLTDAKRVEHLDQVGEWVLVEHRFRSEPSATSMQLRFLIDCEGDGPSAVWIDDVILEPALDVDVDVADSR